MGKWIPWLGGPLPPRLEQEPFEYSRYFAESAVSPPVPTPALFELGSVQSGYRGFLISPGSDKILIERALPPTVPPLSPLPLPGAPREGFKVAAARRGLRVSSASRRVGSLAGCSHSQVGVREPEPRSPAWELQPGPSSSRYQRLSLGSQIVRDLGLWLLGSEMEKGSFRELSLLLPPPSLFFFLFKSLFHRLLISAGKTRVGA